MSYIPHLSTPSLFQDNVTDRDWLPDNYHHFGLGTHPRYQRGSSLPVRRDLPPLYTENGFQASIDVHEFHPKELSVRSYDSVKTVVVEGKHDPRPDGPIGDVERHFTRKFILPDEIDMHTCVITLSADGILTIQAFKHTDKNERVLPIFRTGPAKLTVKHHV